MRQSAPYHPIRASYFRYICRRIRLPNRVSSPQLNWCIDANLRYVYVCRIINNSFYVIHSSPTIAPQRHVTISIIIYLQTSKRFAPHYPRKPPPVEFEWNTYGKLVAIANSLHVYKGKCFPFVHYSASVVLHSPSQKTSSSLHKKI